MSGTKPVRVLLVDAGLGGAFPGYAAHIRESLTLDFGCQVTQVPPQKLSEAAIDAQPWRLMLALHGIHTNRALVARARARGVRTALWITEDPYEIDWHTREWLDAYDHVFTNEMAVLPVYRHPNVTYLRWCTNPRVYRPSPVPAAYRSDVCFVGHGFPNRMATLNAVAGTLRQLDVKLVGNWTAWGNALRPELQRFVLPPVSSPEEVARFYNGAKINLNLHRDPSPSMPNNHNSRNVPARSPNNRTFDIAGCGGFQLVDASRPDLAACYEPGREVVLFRTADDLARKIVHYLDRPEERTRVGEAARHRTLRDHTFAARLRLILQVLFRRTGER